MSAWLVTINNNWQRAVIARTAVEAMSQGGDLWREIHTDGKDVGGIEDINTRRLTLIAEPFVMIDRLAYVLIMVGLINIASLALVVFFRETPIFWPCLIAACLIGGLCSLTAGVIGRREARSSAQ